MENSKKIIGCLLILSSISFSCDSKKKVSYYDEHGIEIEKPVNLKLNLFKSNDNLYISSNYIIQFYGKYK